MQTRELCFGGLGQSRISLSVCHLELRTQPEEQPSPAASPPPPACGPLGLTLVLDPVERAARAHEKPTGHPGDYGGRFGGSGVAPSDMHPPTAGLGTNTHRAKSRPHLPGMKQPLASREPRARPQGCISQPEYRPKGSFCQPIASAPMAPLWPFWNSDLEFQGKNSFQKETIYSFYKQFSQFHPAEKSIQLDTTG